VRVARQPRAGHTPAITVKRRRLDMLFGIIYTERNPSEENQKRSLQLFTNWQPPIEFKGHWVLASGGGMAVAEAESAAAIVEAVAPYTPFLDFKVEPVITIEEAVPIFMKTNAWRESVA
jgi:hypothetical protein